MKDTHKHSFEDEFKKAFEEAEVAPSPMLWAEIDAHLANQEAVKYKRKLYYFKFRAAAAAIVVFGFLGFWFISNDTSVETTVVATSENPETSSSTQNAQGMAEKPDKVSANKEAQVQAENKSIQQPVISAEGQIESDKQEGNTDINPQAPLALSSENTNDTHVKVPASGKPVPEKVSVPKHKKFATSKKADSPGHTPVKKSATDTDILISSTSEPINKINKEPVLNTNTSIVASGKTIDTQKNPLQVINRNNYLLGRLSNNISSNHHLFTLQAPAVQLKANENLLFTEEEKEKKPAVSRWSVAVAFAPSQFDPNMQVNPVSTASLSNFKTAYNGYNNPTTLSPGQKSPNSSLVNNDLQDAENLGFSYNVGINVQYALSERLSLQSGLQYMHNNSQITTDNYLEDFSNRERYPVFFSTLGVENATATVIAQNFSNDIINEQDMIPAVAERTLNAEPTLSNTYPGVTEVLVENLYQYVSIPMRMHYKLINRRLSTSIGAGLSADIFMKNTVGNTSANIPVVEFNKRNNSIYKDVGVSGLVSAKLDYRFSGRYSFYIEPSYRSAITSFTKSGSVKSMPNSFGIGTGFQYRF